MWVKPLVPVGLTGYTTWLATTSSKCCFAQSMSEAIGGMSDSPVCVSEYSTRGGTTGIHLSLYQVVVLQVFLSVDESIFCEQSDMWRWSSLNATPLSRWR
jgi:hypothetical protein